MGSIFAAVQVFLAQIAGGLTARVMSAIGVGVVTITGVQLTMDNVTNHIQTSFGGVPGDIIAVATIAGFDKFLSLVISAYIGVVSVKALWGAFKRFGFMSMGDE